MICERLSFLRYPFYPRRWTWYSSGSRAAFAVCRPGTPTLETFATFQRNKIYGITWDPCASFVFFEARIPASIRGTSRQIHPDRTYGLPGALWTVRPPRQLLQILAGRANTCQKKKKKCCWRGRLPTYHTPTDNIHSCAVGKVGTGEPVHMCLSAFPFKSPTREKRCSGGCCKTWRRSLHWAGPDGKCVHTPDQSRTGEKNLDGATDIRNAGGFRQIFVDSFGRAGYDPVL